jgi:hypothetical protein
MPAISFTTVASFETAPAAWIHRNYLVQNGLSAIVTDEHTVNIYWLYSNAIGGVKVQIPHSEIPEYQQLSEFSPTVPVETDPLGYSDTDSIICPECDSIEISIVKWPKRLIFLTWLVFGFPIPIYAPVLVCNECEFAQRSIFDIPKQFRIIHFLILMTLVASVLGITMQFGVDWLELVSSPTTP